MKQLILRGEPGAKWAFYLNPKVASTSIASSLPEDKQNRILNSSDSEVSGPDWFRFSFVRHPYDRLVSWWLNKVCLDRGASERYRRKWHWGCKQAFSDVVAEVYARYRSGVELDWHLAPQSEVIPAHKMSFIGKFENLGRDWEHIMKLIPEAKPLNRYNVSEGRDAWPIYINQLSPRTQERLFRIYKNDFRIFGYESE